MVFYSFAAVAVKLDERADELSNSHYWSALRA